MTLHPQTKLILIRNGETNHNAAGKFQGHLDSQLSERGRQQAAAVAKRLANVAFAALYSSDLKRAIQTAQPMVRETGHALIADARLRERGFGIFQNHSLHEIQEKYPKEYARFSLRDPGYIIPQGESSNQLTERTMAVFEEIAKRHAGECVVIVTHGGPIGALLRYTLNLSYSALH